MRAASANYAISACEQRREEGLRARRQVVQHWPQKVVTEALRVHGFEHSFDDPRRYQLAVIAWSDADELPAGALEGELCVRMLQRCHAIGETHAEMQRECFDEHDPRMRDARAA